MTTGGVALVRMAKLLKVDEIRQMSAATSRAMKFIVRVGGAKEMVEVDPADTLVSVDTVTRMLADAAARARYRSERELRDVFFGGRGFRDDDVQFVPLRTDIGIVKDCQAWIDYTADTVSRLFGVPEDFLKRDVRVLADPSMPEGSFEIRGASQTVRVVNVGEPRPSRFAAIAEEMEEIT